MTTMTPPLFDITDGGMPFTDAPTARLLLPASASEAEWHAARAMGIGGSDVAAILGLDKYRGPRHVYEAKHGRDPNAVDTEYMEVGREIEGFIAYLFGKRAGVKIGMPPGTLVHRDHPWMRVNIDRYALTDEGEVDAPIECKNRSEYQLDDWEDGVPDSPALQAHWATAVGGWGHSWVAALVGGNKLRYHRLERDEELIGYLIEHCGAWFQRHIVDGFPPPADGLEATKDLLGRLWQVKPADVVTVDLAKARELRALRADLKAQAKEIETALNTVENEMRLLTEAHELANVGNQTAWSWKQNGNFAPAKFAKDHPDIAAQFMRTVEELDIDRLKAERLDLYTQYRARVLRVPAKEL